MPAARRWSTEPAAAANVVSDDWREVDLEELEDDNDGGDARERGVRAGASTAGASTARARTAAARHLARTAPSQYGRWGVAPQHITLLALVLAVVLAVTAWFVLRSAPHPNPVQLANERALPSTPAVTSLLPSSSIPPTAAPVGGALVSAAAATESSPALLVVDVTGKVRRPGIVELPSGSRVVDALRAAGGARPDVRISTLNLARPLVDGEQIVVGLKVPPVDLVAPPEVSGGSTAVAISPVDLNTATQVQLETLPGIGPVTAAAILQWRSENGAFTSVDDLLDVSGIGDITLANIKAYVHV